MKAALLMATLLTAQPADDATLEHRMTTGRVGAVITFVVATTGLALLVRKLGKEARDAEEEARIEHAFRELETDLRAPTQKPSRPPTQPEN